MNTARALHDPKTTTNTLTAGEVLAHARRWYEEMVDAITHDWEQRFRHRQYRPDVEDDWEDKRKAPREALVDRLDELLEDSDLPGLEGLILAVSPSALEEESEDFKHYAGWQMAKDVLARAESLGYFAEPCPEELRFPDLPLASYGDSRDDLDLAKEDLRADKSRLRCAEEGVEGYGPVEKAQADLAASEKRLAGLRDGTIVGLTAEQKEERHRARIREIVLAYRARLEAAGHDVSWIEVPAADDTRGAA